MKKYINLVYSLLFFSYILYAFVLFVLADNQIFTTSPFFQIGSSFSMLGVTFDNSLRLYIFFIFFFLIHSFLATINGKVIDPIFKRLAYNNNNNNINKNNNNNNKNSDDEENLPSHKTLYTILVFYDIWIVIRNLIQLFGILSNFIFFLATSIGFLAADVLVNYVYINYPELLHFESKKNMEKENNKEPEKKPLLNFSNLF